MRICVCGSFVPTHVYEITVLFSVHFECGFVGWWCPDLLALHQECTRIKHMRVHLTHEFAASASARGSRVRQVGIGCVRSVSVCVCVCVCIRCMCVCHARVFFPDRSLPKSSDTVYAFVLAV